MKFKIQLVVVADDGREETAQEIAVLDKDCHSVEHVGLTLAESKTVLKELQCQLVTQQVAVFTDASRPCPDCGTSRKIKGHHSLMFRTLFGNVSLQSPRLHHCRCSSQPSATFSPLAQLFTEPTAPELLYMETKWASLVSYGLTVKALTDFLPIDEKLNASTVRNHTLAVAQRSERGLGEEQLFFIDGCPRDWEALPEPEGPITVGIDGGYLRHWEKKKTNFEVIVGKSVPTDRSPKCFGFVQSYDKKPKRRLFEVLRSQGLQHNQEIAFLSDGEDTVRQLQWYLNPQSDHILDWFHLTMRLTVLGQFLKGLIHLDPVIGGDMQRELERTKWYLWHGNGEQALFWFEDIEMLMYNFEDTYPKFKQLEKVVAEFLRYIERNRHMIRNYGERWRTGQVISTAFTESLVNSLLGKRFTKKQQMQWTHKGAHLLLQTRTKTINNELPALFRQWYADFQPNPETYREAA